MIIHRPNPITNCAQLFLEILPSFEAASVNNGGDVLSTAAPVDGVFVVDVPSTSAGTFGLALESCGD
jgi:hypothetical protein